MNKNLKKKENRLALSFKCEHSCISLVIPLLGGIKEKLLHTESKACVSTFISSNVYRAKPLEKLNAHHQDSGRRN